LFSAVKPIRMGNPWGYGAGLTSQVALIGSTVLFMFTVYVLRTQELLWWVLGGAVLLAWLTWQLQQYVRGPARAWFAFARKSREAKSAASLLHGRSLRLGP
jgi:hypothetical protein